MRFDTTISETEVRTCAPLFLMPVFISIVSFWVKQNAAGIGLSGLARTSNCRLKSEWRGKPQSLTTVKYHTLAVISRGRSLQFSQACCSIASLGA
jgi:hypothetical protein